MRASSKAAPSVDEAAKAALLAEKKGKAHAETTHQEACDDDAVSKRQRNDQPTPEGSLRTCSSRGQPHEPPLGFAPLDGEDATEDGEVIGISAEEQLQLWALRIKNRNHQKQKEILEAKRQRVSMQAKVCQMIRDEEQRAQELEQEIALMQREGQHDLQHGPPLQQRAQVGDLFIPQCGPFIPHAAAFQDINYLDERSPLALQLQVSPWPASFRAGTYTKYNDSTDPAQYIMSYQVVVASSGGDDAMMAKSFIIALEGPALTWYTRLPPLSIDSWRSLRDKFLLNFQGYRPDTDALAELSLYKQQEKETLWEYYRKFLTLKSQLPSVDDQIAIHYAISGLRAGVQYSHYIRDPPKRRPPGTGCLGHNPPTTQELSRTHINTTPHNHTATAPPSIYPTTHTNTTRRYKSYHPHFRLRTRISQTSTTKITPKHQNRKTLLISRIAESFT
jgi:hypothetical protein